MDSALAGYTFFSEDKQRNEQRRKGRNIIGRETNPITQRLEFQKIEEANVISYIRKKHFELSDDEIQRCLEIYFALREPQITDVANDSVVIYSEILIHAKRITLLQKKLENILDVTYFDLEVLAQMVTTMTQIPENPDNALEIFFDVLPKSHWHLVGGASKNRKKVKSALKSRNQMPPGKIQQTLQNTAHKVQNLSLWEMIESVNTLCDKALSAAEHGASSSMRGLTEFVQGLAVSGQVSIEQPMSICHEYGRLVSHKVNELINLAAEGYHGAVNQTKNLGKRFFLSDSGGFRGKMWEVITGQARPSLGYLFDGDNKTTISGIDKILIRREEKKWENESLQRDKEVLALRVTPYFESTYVSMGKEFSRKTVEEYVRLVTNSITDSQDGVILNTNPQTGKDRLQDACDMAAITVFLKDTIRLYDLPQELILKIARIFRELQKSNPDKKALKKAVLTLFVENIPQKLRLTMIDACLDRSLMEEVIAGYNSSLENPDKARKVIFESWLQEQLPAIQDYLGKLPGKSNGEPNNKLQWDYPLNELKLPPRAWFERRSNIHSSSGFDAARGGGVQAYQVEVLRWAHENHILPPLNQSSEKSRNEYRAAVTQLLSLVG